MVNLRPHGIVVADTHAQSGIVLPYQLLNVSQSVVSAIRAVALQPEGPQRQSHVITDHKQPLLVDILLVQPVAHSIATEVHKRGRLQHNDLPALQRRLSDKAIAFVLKNDIGRLCKSVQYHKSGVVSGLGILVAGITQTHNQKLVQGLTILPYKPFTSYSAASAAAEREARVALTEHTITSFGVAISRPSKLSEPTLMALPNCNSVTSMSSFSGICL